MEIFLVWRFPVILILFCTCTQLCNVQFLHAKAPVNPYLADSAWPIAQYDSYAQASSDFDGPLRVTSADTLFSSELAGPLTLLYTEDKKVIWGSSFSSVFKIDRSGPMLRLVDSIKKAPDLLETDTFHGIYSLLSKEGIFYMQTAHILLAYGDSIKGDTFSKIVELGRFDITSITASSNKNYDAQSLSVDKLNAKTMMKDQTQPTENIQAVSMTYSGEIVFLTTRGGAGIMSRDLKTLYDFKYIVDNTKIPIDITNSLSIDIFGGIYIVSSKYMHRIWWDSLNKKLYTIMPTQQANRVFDMACGLTASLPVAPTNDSKLSEAFKFYSGAGNNDDITTLSNLKKLQNISEILELSEFSDEFSLIQKSFQNAQSVSKRYCQIWATSYDIDTTVIVGRPTKEGSGTTPTLFTDKSSGKLFVAIADGKRKQEILIFDTETGNVVASTPVSFTNVNSTGDSYTEQSILVSNNRLLVTQNALTPPAQRLNNIMMFFNAPERAAARGLPSVNKF
ncbi:hypothetical protein IE077_002267 [Cardiosporidium cionae]|uniref:Uncharacterized protein n=1 Tax=Cardiosporidium cionae TaxID=476202 RepID=A0ABQ7JB55_9APIC|nr:hypothetical protein IE077_002267 [Cardiosporidium cionae]|eukprot:KAF8821240.1 hypothetical protein IE077_002267 [Cardiosporidium cionae]